MLHYENEVGKAVKKGTLPKEIFTRFSNAFIALETTGDLGLFDIKKLKSRLHGNNTPKIGLELVGRNKHLHCIYI